MGYTHYFPMKETVKKIDDNNIIFKLIHKEINQAFNDGIIQREYDDTRYPQIYITPEKVFIRFNGVGDDGYETFWFDSTTTNFSFCKTARKPYDLVVCKVLWLLKKYFGDTLELSSDGERSGQFIDGNWPEAIMHVERLVYNSAWIKNNMN